MSEYESSTSSEGPLAELAELLRETIDGEPTGEVKRRVTELVNESAQACKLYVQWMNLHVELGRSIAAEADLAAAPAPLAEDAPAGRTWRENTLRERLLSTDYWRQHRVRFGALALAITLLLWVGVGWFVMQRLNSGGGDDSAFAANTIAQVTALRNVAWAEEAAVYELNHSLEAEDTLELTRGHVEITFRTGAVVLLEGPARFTIDTRSAGTLEQGRLVARIEKSGQKPEMIPFAVSTELAQIIDRGTEFGVEVAADSATQIEVFEGLVEATPRGNASARNNRPLRLTAGQSVRFVPGGDHFEPETPSQFVRELPEEILEGQGLTATGWRQVRSMPIGDGSKLSVYAVHAPRETYTLISFDVSQHFGDRAAGAGTLTLTVQGGTGLQTPGSFVLELRQLNRHNAGVDLANASENLFNEQTGKAWRNNAGENLPTLATPNSVLEITSSLVASKTGPFGGDSPTSAPVPGSRVVLTIPRATLQSWFDQTAPAVVAISAVSPEAFADSAINSNDPQIDFYHFGEGDSQPLPTLSFDVAGEPQE